MKITEYEQAEAFDEGDLLLKDGMNGTMTIPVEKALWVQANSVMRANIYRGKYLGSTVTDEQKAAISAGTFDGLYIGDYWTINGVNYRIADMDYFYNVGDTAFTKHHLVIVPDTTFYNAQMNSSNTTEGGYVGSEMYTANLETAKTTISTAFGDLVIAVNNYEI